MAACCGLEHLLGGIVEVVVLDAANKKKRGMGEGEKVSGGADGRETASSNVLQRGEGRVLLQTLRNVPCALCTDAVVFETASESQEDTSRGADTFVQKRARITKSQGSNSLKNAQCRRQS